MRGLTTMLYRGSGQFLLVHVAGTALLFGVHLLLARLLGPAEYGTFTYVTAWLAVLALIAQLGLGTATLRFVSSYRATEQWSLLRGYLQTAPRAIARASIGSGAVAFAASRLIGSDTPTSTAVAFSVGLLSLPATALLNNSSSALRAFKAISRSQVPIAIAQPLLFGVAVTAFASVSTAPVSAIHVLFAYAGSMWCILAVSWLLLRRLIPTEVRTAVPAHTVPEWRRVAAPLLIVGLLQVIRMRSDSILLGGLASVADVGLYNAANRLASLAVFGLTAVAAWVPPHISEAYAHGDRSRMQQLATVAARATAGFMVPVAIILFAFGPWFLRLFGPDFAAASVALRILVLGQLLNAATGPVGYFLTLTGHQSRVAWVEGASALVNFVLNVALIPPFGIVGAAIAGAVANAFRNASMAWIAWRSLGVRAWIL